MRVWAILGAAALVIILCASSLAQDSGIQPTVINGITLPAVDDTTLQCNKLNTEPDRLSCRLTLNASDTLNYMPEYCRTKSAQDYRDCLAFENAFMSCRKLDKAALRDDCVKQKLGMDAFQGKYGSCIAQQGSYRRLCLQQLDKDILIMAQFRLTVLLDRLKDAHAAGVSDTRVTGLMQRVEQAKSDFSSKRTVDDMTIVLQDMQRDWNLFVRQAGIELAMKGGSQ